VIVIGGGTAGWTAIEALRKLNENLPITLITSDLGDRYMKPQLSIAISQNKTPETLITKKAVDLAQALNVTLVAQTFV
ncbi:tryptophan 7-halogenase, partial [Acinetobacter nosocomialis]